MRGVPQKTIEISKDSEKKHKNFGDDFKDFYLHLVIHPMNEMTSYQEGDGPTHLKLPTS